MGLSNKQKNIALIIAFLCACFFNTSRYIILQGHYTSLEQLIITKIIEQAAATGAGVILLSLIFEDLCSSLKGRVIWCCLLIVIIFDINSLIVYCQHFIQESFKLLMKWIETK